MITNILTALYQPFGFALLLTVLFLFLYLFAQQQGWRKVLKLWLSTFKLDSHFRKLFFLVFYTALILFRTLLNRDMWANPLSNVIGIWGLHNAQGEFTTETVENLILFIPFVILLFWTFRDKLFGEKSGFVSILWQSLKITFLFSLSIELLQLLFRLGTFQLSDLFYNTLGGLIGGVLYWAGHAIWQKASSKEANKKYYI